MIRRPKFVNHFALVALALCLSAGLGRAQNAYEGQFTLPFEARWGRRRTAARRLRNLYKVHDRAVRADRPRRGQVRHSSR